LVVGGGAAGFFAAITAAEANPSRKVILCEATAHPLAKVRVSGGGRCNVTHACFDPKELITRYPRGGRELLGPFHRWQPQDMIAWLADRGVELKTEEDGRMFPVTDRSATIADCLLAAAAAAKVDVRISTGVAEAGAGAGRPRWTVRLTTGETLRCDRLLLASGGGRSSAGFAIARACGHVIEPLVPSLFTFQIDDSRLKGLEGLSVPDAAARVEGEKLAVRGAALVTHQGLSGPAILKLSAWGARELAARNYQFTVVLSWVGERSAEQVRADFAAARAGNARKQLATWNPCGLPARLWERLLAAVAIGPHTTWSTVTNAALEALAAQVTASAFTVTGKSTNKEEFVTCGGVRLAEVDFKTMESKLCPELYFAGEVLDIDGITGGFNFQSAWTTGWIAGAALAQSPEPNGT
jgi:predicted Rossmann fold flavoprotein